MVKEKWYRKWVDFLWITILMCVLVFGPIIMIDHFMAMARDVRQQDPTAVPVVQVWADMETGIWNMWLTIGHRTEVDGVVNWTFHMRSVGRNDPTPYEYRNATGQECIMSYYLDQYEWFYGRQGDI